MKECTSNPNWHAMPQRTHHHAIPSFPPKHDHYLLQICLLFDTFLLLIIDMTDKNLLHGFATLD